MLFLVLPYWQNSSSCWNCHRGRLYKLAGTCLQTLNSWLITCFLSGDCSHQIDFLMTFGDFLVTAVTNWWLLGDLVTAVTNWWLLGDLGTEVTNWWLLGDLVTAVTNWWLLVTWGLKSPTGDFLMTWWLKSPTGDCSHQMADAILLNYCISSFR